MGKCCSSIPAADTWDKSTPLFSVKGRIRAKVVYVYDGDTIHVVFPMYDLKGKKVCRRWKCRLTGIDTPEIRTKNPEENKFAIQVRDILHSKIHGKMIWMDCVGFDKYGRLLITIPTLGLGKEWTVKREKYSTVNEWLIAKGYAYVYDGGKKQLWII